jgi:hypothetical protein
MVFTGSMHRPEDIMTESRHSRRALLTGALAGAAALTGLVGCRPDDPTPNAVASPQPLRPLLAGTLDLVARYQATVSMQPSLAYRLAPLLAECQAHATALAQAMGQPATAAASGGPGPSASPTGLAASVPADPVDALAALRTVEQTGRGDATNACLAAPAEHAALLGAIVASRACHLEVLV